mmetsp:Transcript_65397/g.206659  ORF Transcript_65397/g.206659 Transcript_65397/m.206659 type:complete len:905 (-) Transcript_65397:279-2993(-)
MVGQKAAWLLLALLATASLIGPCAAVEETALAENEEAQADGLEAPNEVVSATVTEADPVDLQSGTGDVSTTDDCADDIKEFCSTTEVGENRLRDCLTKQQEAESKGNVDGKTLSEPCKVELKEFKVVESTNINLDVGMAGACKEDADKFCKDAANWDEPGPVIACLREVKEEIGEACLAHIFLQEKEAAKDMDVDPVLHEMCEADAKTLCPGIKPGEGLVQACLREKHFHITWECEAELFRQEIEDADDVRLNIVLLRACMGDKKKFCPEIAPGHHQVKDCLEENRGKDGFSSECKTHFEEMMERRAGDFRLDTAVRSACEDDIVNMCGVEADSLGEVSDMDGRVLACLQDYRDEIVAPECQAATKKVTERASQDIRFDEPLADKCYDDRLRLCEGIPPGNARVIRCLQDNRNDLDYACRAQLFEMEVRMAEDIDFQFPMKQACSKEVDLFCKDIPHGHARIIECLQEHDDSTDMSTECKSETKRQEIRSSEDFRLNYRLNRACDLDVEKLCKDACDSVDPNVPECGGLVLQCLTEKGDDITSDECRKEVFGFEKKEAKDWRMDAPLHEACVADKDLYCKNVQDGRGRVHDCLRANRDKLSKKCREQELKLNKIQAQDIELQPSLNAACSEEKTVFCKDVEHGRGRIFKCLQENMAKPDFGGSCLEHIKSRESRMSSDYRLDFGVATTCKTEIGTLCKDAKQTVEEGDTKGSGAKGRVLTCLAGQNAALGAGCQKEVSRAVRMAVWQFKAGNALTAVCDDDAASLCSEHGAKGSGVAGIGAVGNCLAKQLAADKPLKAECKKLMMIASPPDAKAVFDSSMTQASVIQGVLDLEKAAGLDHSFTKKNGGGNTSVTLTGWVAIAALVSLVAVVAGGGFYCYKKHMADYEPAYTIVSKAAPAKSGDV